MVETCGKRGPAWANGLGSLSLQNPSGDEGAAAARRKTQGDESRPGAASASCWGKRCKLIFGRRCRKVVEVAASVLGETQLSPDEVVDQLNKVQKPRSTWEMGGDVEPVPVFSTKRNGTAGGVGYGSGSPGVHAVH